MTDETLNTNDKYEAVDDDDDEVRSATSSRATTSSSFTADHNANYNATNKNPEEEIRRVMANRRNYYAVLNLTPQMTTNASVKRAYHGIARLIHPDKCKHSEASKAMSVVTAANSTLTTPKLKKRYDLYYNTQDVSENAQGGENFDEWNSKIGAAMAALPAWLVKALSTPILGSFVMIVMFVLVLIFGAIVGFLLLCYLVVHLVFWVLCCCGCGGHCWPRYGEGARIHEIRQKRFMAMLRDYEEAQMHAATRGDPDPDVALFMQQWNLMYPEDLSFPEGYDPVLRGSGSAYGATDENDGDAYFYFSHPSKASYEGEGGGKGDQYV